MFDCAVWTIRYLELAFAAEAMLGVSGVVVSSAIVATHCYMKQPGCTIIFEPGT